MSCDNMPENGHVMRNVTCAYARAVDAELAAWIEANVTFPSTMVDRIVPAVTPETLDKIEQLTGVRDPAGVACEPFRQWVIEDNFVAGRPQWEKAGAELVADVIPFGRDEAADAQRQPILSWRTLLSGGLSAH
ncbi:protein YdfI [Enterobacter cloacae]|uniref:Protein YdfI n=1 Tax=Enterobacter cloacae TaxID=550 RepID=A0A377M349_ENTCL|nr:protein YdfI [Enterobacter cloacae]